jgi:predicted nucleic acid-binding protein
MYLLSRNYRTQNEFLSDLSHKLYQCIPLLPQDFARIRQLNEQYADLPGDFADLSLITVSERLNISAIITLDSDFDIYRRYRKESFERIYLE